ncbi:MAG TPA: nuclear transport factor 2 family protein [Candidatus Binatia bacterium]|nr:nuclear transport factor 2 family protein [Candidatus Binatia bacterium]
MKNIAVPACLLLLAAGLAFAMAGDSAPAQQEIDRVLTAWHQAAAVADATTYFDALAPGAVFLGTDLRERWEKEAFRKWAAPFFKRPSAWTFRASRRQVSLSADGNTAWFDEDLVSESYWPCRGSGVLEKTGGQWKIRQYNLALTIPNEATRDIRPLVEAALRAQAAAGNGSSSPPQ